MIDIYKMIRPLVFKLGPECAHTLALKYIRAGLIPDRTLHDVDVLRLEQSLFGVNFPTPVGLAAGFDKNGEIVQSFHKLGFGFAEVGTVTPKPQAGNPKPRVFRLPEHNALINRLGFNNRGVDSALQNINLRSSKDLHNRRYPVGINIGPNKTSTDFSTDYIFLIEKIYKSTAVVDYITINVSSPNTIGLRNLQDPIVLGELLDHINNAAQKSVGYDRPLIPMLLKLAPDLEDSQLEAICRVAEAKKISGLIISNTTIQKSGLTKNDLHEGGLSGRPLFDLSTDMLRKAYGFTGSRLPLIGVGGISSAQDVLTKIKAGASLVQLYTGLVFEGLDLPHKINTDLLEILEEQNITNISDLKGTDI